MIVDLLVIGGGINGCSVAADAAGRGLSVILCDKEDLAFATSSSSSKLIHGGLRYLEQYNIKLVRESLKERDILMSKAPFMIHPIEFVLPYNNLLRPTWMIRLGLMIYDFLYFKRTLPRSRKFDLQNSPEGEPIKTEYKIGFSYSDCWTDDSRLVILNALAAREKGARILTRTACTKVKRENDYWHVQLHDQLRDKEITLKAKAVVNATGPWAIKTLKDVANLSSKKRLRLVQGSHIVLPKLYEGNHAYTLQNSDNRIVFVIPYKSKYTLIGTTETPFDGDPTMAAITNTEINYLCDSINHYFDKQVSDDDIVWSFSGIRPLFDDRTKNFSKMSREARINVRDHKRKLPFVSIFGGKLTTHRLLAEEVMQRLKPYFPEMGPSWTANEKLPGGDCDGLSYPDFVNALQKKYDWLPPHVVQRYAKAYGDQCHAFLSDCHSINDMGQYFGETLYEREVLHMIKNEWAQTVDDILWRRSKLGLRLTPEEVNALDAYLNGQSN